MNSRITASSIGWFELEVMLFGGVDRDVEVSFNPTS
jgi:hypothetical protein